MKRWIPLILAAALVPAGVLPALAEVDFKVKGEWDTYFNFGEATLFKRPYGDRVDVFDPVSRIRTEIEAAVSENLAGNVQFEMGNYAWGTARAGTNPAGATIGERSASVKVKRAYLDGQAPGTNLRLSMGLQGIALPNVAGGSAVMDDDAMSVAAAYKINDNAGITAVWMRPYNDNYKQQPPPDEMFGGRDKSAYLDNFDLGMLSLPLTFDAFSVTPWVMYGQMGRNAARQQLHTGGIPYAGDYLQRGLFPIDMSQRRDIIANANFGRPYADLYWAGIPVKISALDPFNFEFDANYGYTSGFGKYDDTRVPDRRNDSRREGFVIKALAEYKLDWAVPGIFGWYGSGDNGNTRDGSERMPYLTPAGNFSSFGLAGYYGDMARLLIGEVVDISYAGTWAVGAQMKDLSFMEKLSHTARVIYWRGTNDPAMAKSLRNPLNPSGNDRENVSWNRNPGGTVYLTENDYLVEFNLDSAYKFNDNLEACLELGYIVNGVDKSTWKWDGNQKNDAWKTALILRYSF